MNYYAIYDARSGVLLAEGNSLECKRKLGCSSMDTFYALVNRSRRGINHKYKVVIKKPKTMERLTNLLGIASSTTDLCVQFAVLHHAYIADPVGRMTKGVKNTFAYAFQRCAVQPQL